MKHDLFLNIEQYAEQCIIFSRRYILQYSMHVFGKVNIVNWSKILFANTTLIAYAENLSVAISLSTYNKLVYLILNSVNLRYYIISSSIQILIFFHVWFQLSVTFLYLFMSDVIKTKLLRRWILNFQVFCLCFCNLFALKFQFN